MQSCPPRAAADPDRRLACCSAVVRELTRRAEGKNLCLITIGSSVPFYERLGFREIPAEVHSQPVGGMPVLGAISGRFASALRPEL